ncbi:hypothetical protein [Brachyspira pilosicoli]|uniref:hypothetical protein n=1 Tax=Brachyspira pilosicoli TaxID=52584 RepID=UPI000E139723|nr:hypothetical protein [Brachyspira pilosicoli]SUW05075.1 Uncharacterised protein [Brachyspira pilosicoli]SUW09070.1 Uncharacterised protein [Brachyspira pilosicoli]
MNIKKLIDSLQVYRNQGSDTVVVHNDNFSCNHYIKNIEIDKDNPKQINLIIGNIFICDALKFAKKYKNKNEIIRI